MAQPADIGIEDMPGEFDGGHRRSWLGPAILALGCGGVLLVLFVERGRARRFAPAQTAAGCPGCSPPR